MTLRIFFVLLTVVLWPEMAAAEADTEMAMRLKACAACHGEQGRSQAEAYYPSIAGKPQGYLYAQLKNFQTERRQHAVMKAMLQVLSDDYLNHIAGYYARQTPATLVRGAAAADAVMARGRQLVEEGDAAQKIPACAACHGAALTGLAPAIPGLLGLPADYLSAQVGAWRAGTRHAQAPDCMATVAKQLSLTDITAVTAWIAHLPQPAAYAPAPARTSKLPMDCGGVP